MITKIVVTWVIAATVMYFFSTSFWGLLCNLVICSFAGGLTYFILDPAGSVQKAEEELKNAEKKL